MADKGKMMLPSEIELIDKAIEMIRAAIVPPKHTSEAFPLAAEDALERGMAYVSGRIAGIRQEYLRDHQYAKAGNTEI
jgi:hypothetical protein